MIPINAKYLLKLTSIRSSMPLFLRGVAQGLNIIGVSFHAITEAQRRATARNSKGEIGL